MAKSTTVYTPRARGGAMQDALAEAKLAMSRLARILVYRGAGLLLIAAALAAMLALITYNSADPSINHATGNIARNWLGPFGAVAADLLLQSFGFAAICALTPLLVWGAHALIGRSLKYALWRAMAWPLSTVMVAGGLGLLPAPDTLPAGSGGLIGIAAYGLSVHAGAVWGAPWLSFVLPLLLLLIGLPLAFLATGLKWKPLLRAATDIPATAVWLGGLLKFSNFRRPRAHDDDEDRHEPYSDDEDDEGYHLGDDDEEDEAPAPRESVAERRLAERRDARESRVKRDASRKSSNSEKRTQTALNLDSGEYQLPALDLLSEPVAVKDTAHLTDEALEENARMLEAVLSDFGVKGRITAVRPGPVVTLYEFEPAAGVKSSRVISLADDVARNMSAVSARIATISGRNVIGIELPNQTRETIYLRDMFASGEYEKARAPLTLALGKTIGGEPVMADLAKMPHLLVAGTTGSGKSVGLNTMILSLLYRMSPQQCRLIMIDPKMLELSVYDGIPHLLSPVVTDPKKAVVALKWAVREMEERYKNMAKLGVRNIDGYNTRLLELKAKGEEPTRTVHTGFDKETGKAIYEEEKLSLDPLPYIVIIVDEMADLMMVAGKDIEGAVQRLAQMARAAGLHVILATQRPSVDVITGTIKANFPTRIAFQVTSKIDSRTILGEMGAEQLLGQGDMLYMAGGGRISRVHGPFASDEEVEKVVRHLKTQGQPEYLEAVTAEEPSEDEDGAVFDATGMGGDGGGDLFQQAVAIVKRDRKASTSYIQRRLQIGYNRAASLMERMELEGIVGPANHAGKREILVEEEDSHM